MSVLAPIAEGAYRPIAAIATCSSYGTRPMANKGPIAAIAAHSPTFFYLGQHCKSAHRDQFDYTCTKHDLWG